jgi:hypothetical protein
MLLEKVISLDMEYLLHPVQACRFWICDKSLVIKRVTDSDPSDK